MNNKLCNNKGFRFFFRRTNFIWLLQNSKDQPERDFPNTSSETKKNCLMRRDKPMKRHLLGGQNNSNYIYCNNIYTRQHHLFFFVKCTFI